MFLNVVNDDATAVDIGVVEGVENEACAFQFVFEVRSVNQNGLIVFLSQLYVFLKNGEFIFGVFV